MPRKLTAAQIVNFHRDGFLAPIDVMSVAKALSLKARLESIEMRYPDAIGPTNRNNAHYAFRCVDEMVHHPEILDAVEDLIGPDLLLWSTVLFIKEPDSRAHVSWHQDVTYMGIAPHDGVTAWLALTPSTIESGCVMMIPESHTDAIRPHRDTFGEDNILTRGQNIDDVDSAQAVNIELDPGQMSLHHLRTIHASAPNRSAARRIGVAMQAYMPPSVKQTMGHDFALLVRGEDRYGHFELGRRPSKDNDPDGTDLRSRANERFAEILYAGASRRRAL